MWFEKLLIDKRHFIEIDTDFSNINIKKIKNPEKIAKNGYRFSKKYINKKMIATYWYLFMCNINNLII
jgi:hypothetical protein